LKKVILYLVATFLCFGIYLISAKASVSFSATFDSGFDADSGADKTAFTDGSLPSLVTGYGGTGQAIKNTFGTTLKYKTSNLNSQKDSISFKFQLPFDLKTDKDIGRIGGSSSHIDVSETSGYTYIADFVAEQIIRTKIDGTGWKRLGDYGTSGDGKFNFCWRGDVSVDSRDETLYITDSCNKRIIKTKMDGSDWQAYPIGAYSPAQIFYDKVSDEIYFYDEGGDQVVSTKFGSDVFNAVSLSGVSAYMTDFIYDSAGGFIYLLDGGASNLSRIKMDGSGLAAFGSSGSGIDEFDSPYALDYDGTYFYIMDEYNSRIVKTQFDGTGWQTYGSQGLGEGKFNDATSMAYDENSGDIFVLDNQDRYTNNSLLIKTKIDGSSWQSFATQGVGSINDLDSMIYDNNTGYYYFAGGYNSVIRTKKDGTDWSIVGTHGDGQDPFSFGYVTGIDVDKSNSDVYTIDHYADQISKFKMNESEWSTWAGPIPGGGSDFSVPRGISLDQANKILYVGDMDHHRIVKTKMDGSLWETYGTLGSGVGQFNYPMNVYYDPITEYVYVSDDGNPRI